MSEISLTASMRSNLLSLQQIAKLQDSTQLRLSTGLKVNSAIDNPSSYYTASSLNNRAEDLSALLDSMGQSVQTIKAATEGIEKAEDLLSQMKAIAEQVNTGVYVPEKSYFEKLVGANGAVVTNAEELHAAIDSGKEEICVYGKIDLGDISTAGGLNLQENQKLVGVNYYGNFGTEGEEFSGISATSSAANNMIDIKKTGCLVSDLSLNYENSANSYGYGNINIGGKDVECNLQNLNIKIKCNTTGGNHRGGIITNQSVVNLGGRINIDTFGDHAHGIHAIGGSVRFLSDSKINISVGEYIQYGLLFQSMSTLNIDSNASVNIKSYQWGIQMHSESTINIQPLANVNIESNNAAGLYLYTSYANIMGNIRIQSENSNGFNLTSNSKCYMGSTAQCFLDTKSAAFIIGYNATNPGILDIASGAKIAVEKNGHKKWCEVTEDYHDEATTSYLQITADNFETTLKVASTSAWKTAGDVVAEQEQEKAEKAEKEAEEQANREVYQKQYNNALSQYDSLIKDSSYKGVNLLQADDLKVIFNENRSSTLEVSGVDLSSDKIGMMTADWSKAKDVQTSLNQVIEAKNTLRSASTKLGNYYSIITERETFTDNLINVLEEGADKLTLADMNEESANMLSLQTQQQLAINSLSLASQSSQSILRLF